MRKLQISDQEIMRIAVQQEILRSEESRYDHRLHGILLISQGLSCYDVADVLGPDPRTIERLPAFCYLAVCHSPYVDAVYLYFFARR